MQTRGIAALFVTGALVACQDSSSETATMSTATTQHAASLVAPSFVPTDTSRDALGFTRVRFRQTVKGVPVFGREASVHYRPDGSLQRIDSQYDAALEAVDVAPSLSKDAAIAVAVAAQKAVDPAARVQSAELVVRPEGTLTFKVDVRSSDPNQHDGADYFVDAHDGSIVKRLGHLRFEKAQGKGNQAGMRTFDVSKSGSRFVARDTARNIETWDAQNSGAKKDQEDPTEYVAKALIGSDSLTAGWDPAGVTAHSLAGEVYDFYRKELGRDGIDGKHGLIKSLVHVGQKEYGNAFWDGEQMCYGDNSTIYAEGADADPWSMAHELTHGVVQYTSNLTYEGDSGALNEAIADIMSADFANTWYHEKWLSLCSIGDECFLEIWNPGDKYGPGFDHMNAYVKGGEMHMNGAIINTAANYMAVGGTNEVSKIKVSGGFGWEKVGKLFYRANTTKLMESATFADAVKAVAESAEDLGFTEEEKATVDCAWRAVGLLDGECKKVARAPSPSAKDVAEEKEETSEPAAGASAAEGGCSAAPARTTSPGSVLALLGLTFVVARRRRSGRL